VRELRIFLGGSFDPVHIAHERVAMQVSVLLNQPVYLLPTSQSPFKDRCCASDKHRLNMLQLVADAAHIAIETYELQQTGVHYTADTVRYFLAKAILPVFIVGWDAFASLSRWREFDFIRARAAWIVVQRHATDLVLEEALRSWWHARRELSSASLPTIKGGDLFECHMPLQNVSSTQVRAKLQATKTSNTAEPAPVLANETMSESSLQFQSELNPRVLAYIQEHGLYHQTCGLDPSE